MNLHLSHISAKRAFAGLLAVGLALSGITIAATAAHAETLTATYVSSANGVTTSEVEAIVLGPEQDGANSGAMLSGWYVCTGETILNSLVAVGTSGGVNLILADDCELTVTEMFGVYTGSSLKIWSGVANTGSVTAIPSSGVPGLYVPATSSLTISGGSIKAIGAPGGSAGIGGVTGEVNGSIAIQWRANVEATGGAADVSHGGGAGIGGGGNNTPVPLGGSNISVNTSGLVRATGGANSGTILGPGYGAPVGKGGATNSTNGTDTIFTFDVAAPATVGSGSVLMRDMNQQLVPAGPITGVVMGSTVTYVGAPADGYQIQQVTGSLGVVVSLGDNTYQYIGYVSPGTNKVIFTFAPLPVLLTLAVSPTAGQTRPGDVTLTAKLSDGGMPAASEFVEFLVDDVAKASVKTDALGVATFTLASPAVGTYSFGASFAGSELHNGVTANPITGYVVRDPLPVTVTANNESIIFGDPLPEFTWTEEPELESTDTLTGSLKLEGDLVLGDNAIVEDEPFANPKYLVTFVPGVLTVSPNEAQVAATALIESLPDQIATIAGADKVAEATNAFAALTSEERAALPQELLDQLETAQGQARLINHIDPEGGVSAFAETLPWSVRLIATLVEGSDSDVFKNELPAERSLLGLYDIHFVNTLDGTTWQPGTGETVEIELSRVHFNGYGSIQVQHQRSDGTLETVPSHLSGNRVRFEGASFSLYGVTGIANSGGTLAGTGSDGPALALWVAVIAALAVGAGALGGTRRKHD